MHLLSMNLQQVCQAIESKHLFPGDTVPVIRKLIIARGFKNYSIVAFKETEGVLQDGSGRDV